MQVIEFEVGGKPRPLSRTGHGQFGGKFLSAPSSQQIGLVIEAWKAAGSERLPDNDPLRMDLLFVFDRPASHFGTGRNAGILKGRFIDALPTSRPDVDNLAKLICEALQGNAFKDDSRVVSLNAAKCYGRARTQVRVETIS